MAIELSASFETDADFLGAFDTELSRKGLLVRLATVGAAPPMSPCTVTLRIAGVAVLVFEAKIAAVVPGVGVAVLLDTVPAALNELAARTRQGASSEPPLLDATLAAAGADENPTVGGTASERLKSLSVAEKIQAALSGDRELRFALLRDTNKTLHVFVLRNPRIGLDEVQAAAKMPGLSPDALKLIADHREWGLNSAICTSLVRNPKLQLPLALRLLDRIPSTELRALAKGGAREQLVQAARKRLAGS